MDEKRIIIIGLILAAVLGGLVFLFGQGEEIAESDSDQQSANLSEATANMIKVKDFQGYNIIGSSDAPVKITEYFSYNCGHCRNFSQDTLQKIKEEYIDTGKVQFEMRQLYGVPQFPLAVLCAGEQGKFLEYHDYLFENLSQITSEEELPKLIDFAKSLDLDQKEFQACFDSGKYALIVENWAEEGKAAGVSGVPAFFVGEQKLVGNQPYEKFQEAIEEELSK